MLKPNQPVKVSLYGNDYVLWQDCTGKISGLPNACPHDDGFHADASIEQPRKQLWNRTSLDKC
jgi:hypothetical protein